MFDLISKDKVTLLDKKVKVVCQYNYSMVIDTNQQTSIMHIKSIILAKLQDNKRKYCSTKRSKNKEKGQFKLMKRKKSKQGKRRQEENILLNFTFLTKMS